LDPVLSVRIMRKERREIAAEEQENKVQQIFSKTRKFWDILEISFTN
jgi:hypothetical protein